MRDILRDVIHFGRVLAKSPGFFAVAVLTLGLGIGANTAIFSVLNAVLLRRLPFAEPDRLVRLFETEAAPRLYPFAAPDYLDWQAENRTLEGMALCAWSSRSNVSGAGEPQSALAVRVQASFFPVLGVRPLAGREFVEGEAKALEEPVEEEPAHLHSTPGVQAASASTLIPLEGGSNGYITVPGVTTRRSGTSCSNGTALRMSGRARSWPPASPKRGAPGRLRAFESRS